MNYTKQEFIDGLKSRHNTKPGVLQDIEYIVRDMSTEDIGAIFDAYRKTWDKDHCPRAADIYKICQIAGVSPTQEQSWHVIKCPKCSELRPIDLIGCPSCKTYMGPMPIVKLKSPMVFRSMRPHCYDCKVYTAKRQDSPGIHCGYFGDGGIIKCKDCVCQKCCTTPEQLRIDLEKLIEVKR